MARLNIAALDKQVKWALLIASTLTLILLAAAALEENVFDDWRLIRADYAALLEEKARNERDRTIASQFEIGIDQNVMPALGAIDRCITCHTGLDDPRMADQAQPFKTHPGTLLQTHPPEQFGCTVCHQGQGRATKEDDAHGHVEDWLFPMFEKRFLYSACAKCHDERSLFDQTFLASGNLPEALPAPTGAALMAQGKSLLDQKGCLGCHKLDGLGGKLGPDITYVGDKTRHDFDFSHFRSYEPHDVATWLKKHFLEPSAITPDTTMPDMDLTEREAEALTAYVMSLRRREVPADYKAPVPADAPEPVPPTGEELYRLMCAACHGADGRESEVPGIRSPSLNNVDTLAVSSDDYLRFIIDQGRSNTAMPSWGPESENLTYEQIDQVVAHIRGWEAEGADPALVSARGGDAEMGRAYYEGNCSSCHGRAGQGAICNALNSSAFLAIVSDRFMADTIIEGRPGTAMASWKHLPAQAVSDILAYIRSWETEPPAFEEVRKHLRSANAEDARVGAILYQGNCSTCHGRSGEGGIGPALNSRDVVPVVTDEYLYRTIVEGRPTTAMPAWKHLSADRIAAIIQYMRSWFNGARRAVVPAPRRGDYALGEVHYKLACAGCHGQDAEGGVGPQLANPAFLSAVSEDVLYRWVAHGRAGTAMRGFLPEEQGPVRLTPGHIADVLAYIRYKGSQADRPVLRTGVGNPVLGQQIFAGSCAGCHGSDGEGTSGPQLHNGNFLRAASDGFLMATIALGRDGTPMRSMIHGQEGIGQVEPDEIQDVVAYMRLWDISENWRRPRAVAEMSERAIHAGRQNFARYCAGCHGPNGLGTEDGEDHFAPALNNPEFLSAASDGYLLATIARGRSRTPMRPFGKGAGGIASLDAGEISDIVSYIRTWQEAYAPAGD